MHKIKYTQETLAFNVKFHFNIYSRVCNSFCNKTIWSRQKVRIARNHLKMKIAHVMISRKRWILGKNLFCHYKLMLYLGEIYCIPLFIKINRSGFLNLVYLNCINVRNEHFFNLKEEGMGYCTVTHTAFINKFSKSMT